MAAAAPPPRANPPKHYVLHAFSDCTPVTLVATGRTAREARMRMLASLRTSTFVLHAFPYAVDDMEKLALGHISGPPSSPNQMTRIGHRRVLKVVSYANLEDCVRHAWLTPWREDRVLVFTALDG